MADGGRLEEMRKEIGKWKNRALDAAEHACFNCEEYVPHDDTRCQKCRIRRIKEEAAGGERDSAPVP